VTKIAHTKMMAFDPRTPQRIYAAIEQGALLKTEDGGQSWRELADYSKPTTAPIATSAR
jgi:photosystem II stability/assembly factor-like uncharacterized protein